MIIKLSDDEALVLLDLLANYLPSDDIADLHVRHAAERTALLSLLAQLERKLVAPFQNDYADQVAAARARLLES